MARDSIGRETQLARILGALGETDPNQFTRSHALLRLTRQFHRTVTERYRQLHADRLNGEANRMALRRELAVTHLADNLLDGTLVRAILDYSPETRRPRS